MKDDATTTYTTIHRFDRVEDGELRCTHDLDGRLLTVSAAAARALGYEVNELHKIPMVQLVAPQFRHRIADYLDAIRRDGVASGRMRILTSAGAQRVWEYRNALCEGAGAPIVVGIARDVTDAVIAEHALRASEDRFAVAFYSSPIAMAITTMAEGRYVEVNEAFEQQMGYSRSEICGFTSLELNVWPSPQHRVAMIAALQRDKTLRGQHAQFRTKSGQLITTLYSAGLITLEGRTCVLAAIADITAQRRAETALRESESKFRFLAEATHSGIFIFRRDGTLCYFNPQVEAVTGFSAEELRSMRVWDLVHPDFRDPARARGEARWQGKDIPDRHEFQIVTRDGSTRWIDFTARITQFEGAPAILGTAFDITESKRNEQQALEHTALLQTLIMNSPFAIMVGDRTHRIRLCNPAFSRLFQYSEEEVVGQDPDDLVGLPESTEATDISSRVLSGQVVHATAVRRRKDGSRVNVELHAIPLMRGDSFAGCFGIYQDITERVESEAKLQELRSRVTRAQDEERAHVARELHDNIGQRVALLSLRLEELQRDARVVAPSLAAQLGAAIQLNEEICVDAHRLSHRLHPSQLAYIGLTKSLASFCEEFGRQKGLEITFRHDDVPELKSEVTTCLYRVAQEAVRNAGKHSGCRQIRLELVSRTDAVCLCVSDTGRGFAAGAAEGMPGLGLVSMAERVRSVGGALSVVSEIDVGTRIEVSIPLGS
jgi:PAS domain S-box-containing protein